MTDEEQLLNVQTQLNTAIAVALKKRHELMLKLPEEDKKTVLKFETDYRKLIKSGNYVEANALHHKFIEKYSK